MNTPIATHPIAPWLERYALVPGVYDEMLDESGALRPNWTPTLEAYQRLGADEVHTRSLQAQREIARDGITYNPHEDTSASSRTWQLDAVPLLIHQQDWKTIQDGLQQWTALGDLVLRDLFGPQRLLADRVIPPDLLYGHPKYHPAYHSAHEPGQTRLHLCASDLARSADGHWWTTGLRTRAPFGLGYVIENRVMMSRIYPEIYRDRHIHRIAPFFVALRDKLMSLTPRPSENPRIVLWSEGPEGRSYFEDAYLARYLNYSLVLSGDLAVRHNRVVLKTLRGLLPVDVLFRRIDDEACDSVELDVQTALGVPGLTQILRARAVGMANGLGCNLLEAPALYAFAQSLAETVLGTRLVLPPVATWWCGERPGLEYVLANFDSLLIRNAFAVSESAGIDPTTLSAPERDALIAKLKENPRQYVGQERVERSTTPVWKQSGLEAWRMGLRAFCVATRDGFESLYGGLAHVSPDPSLPAEGGPQAPRGQDVWIVSDGPVDETSLLPTLGERIEIRRHGADLPSRVCDNLFWLGRTLERIESFVRFQRAAFRISAGEYDTEFVDEFLARTSVAYTQSDTDASGSEPVARDPKYRAHLQAMVFDVNVSGGLQGMVEQAVRLASTVRDRIAVEMWRSVRDIEDKNAALLQSRGHGDTSVLSYLDGLLAALNGFAGLVHESMTRTDAWLFLDLGRRIERALQAADLLHASLIKPISDERAALELLLEIADSIMTYRGRYLGTVQAAPVLDLLAIDESNPRSIAFQLAEINAHVGALRGSRDHGVLGDDQRLALSMLNAVRLADIDKLAEVDKKGVRSRLSKSFGKTKQQLISLSDAVSSQYLVHAGSPRHFGSATEFAQ